jgi:hypothetical protein
LPLKEADLKTVESYKKALKLDVSKLASGNVSLANCKNMRNTVVSEGLVTLPGCSIS